jgi:uncharacterized repeat protein (TIGR03847 family)
VGTVGEPGQRTFFLQVRSGSTLTSVVLEKTQAAALADQLEVMLDDIVRRSGGRADVPAATPSTVDDLAPLELPLEQEFRVGTLGLAWDGDTQRVELMASALTTRDDPDADDPTESRDSADGDDEAQVDTLVVTLTGAQARAFISRARAVVGAGRPPCPFCAQPLDPSGHVCPRQNGFRRRS